MGIIEKTLPFSRVSELASRPPEQAWLIRDVWAQSAVGIIGGAPKCCKSWLGLDMAVSVASGTPCLDSYPVDLSGPVLIFQAEDAVSAVRSRIESVCSHRRLDINQLELYAITASTLRLDLTADQHKLTRTLSVVRPRLMILDPLVRLHRLDENSAADISKLLGFIRELQREFDMAVVLVHHASKKHRAQPGQALRGSSDLHAFGDSNAYLARRKDRIVLSMEHRSAKAPDPVEMELISQKDGSDTHLQIVSPIKRSLAAPLGERVLALLKNVKDPLPRTAIRSQLRVNNQRLGQCLVDLDNQGAVIRTSKGYIAFEAKQIQSGDAP